jgi:hypothetical protein
VLVLFFSCSMVVGVFSIYCFSHMDVSFHVVSMLVFPCIVVSFHIIIPSHCYYFSMSLCFHYCFSLLAIIITIRHTHICLAILVFMLPFMCLAKHLNYLHMANHALVIFGI